MAAEIFHVNAVMDGARPAEHRVERLGPFATFNDALEAGDQPGIELFTIDKVYVPEPDDEKADEKPKRPAKKAATKK